MISKCIFPVAGFGTRFLPVTKNIPKEMLPILSTPLIELAVNEANNCEITEMIMIINKDKASIKDYFSKNETLDSLILGTDKEAFLENIYYLIQKIKFSFVNQDSMRGLGHAILQGKDLVNNEAFAVILPDDLCYNNGLSVMKQMSIIHEKYPDKCIIAIEEVDERDVNKYGIVDGNTIEGDEKILMVTNMIEKPNLVDAPSNLAIIGRYILPADIFKVIESTEPDHRGEIQITDALVDLAKKGRVIAYKFDGVRLDCGSVDGYINANNFFLKMHQNKFNEKC